MKPKSSAIRHFRSLAFTGSAAATLASQSAQAGPITWNSAGATTTAWSLGSNWIGGVAPVNGDDVFVTADGANDPTTYNNAELNSLTLSGATSLTLNGLKVGAGGVFNTMLGAGQTLFLNGTTTLLADQTWGGTRTILVQQATGAFKLTFNGSFARFDTNSAGWSGGLDVRTTVGMGGNYAVGAITPFGTGTVTLINQRSDGLTSSSPILGLAGAAANNSLANANTIANNIALSDPGTGNFTITQNNDAAPSTGHFYILSGNITGAVNSARTLSFTNTHGSAAATLATFVLTGTNTYAAQTIIGTNTTLQIGNGGTVGTLGSSTAAISNAGTLAINRSDAFSVGNVISGAGGLQQLGGGTTTLTGGNLFTGATTISAGTLQLGNGSTTGSLATTSAITNNATLAFNRSNALTQGTDFASVIDGTGSLQQLGGGTTTLSGNNSYSGTTSVNAGVLRASHANALGTTAGGTSVTSGAALELSGTIAIGAEALALNGSGISSGGALRNISGTNSHAGLITLNGATRINSDSGLLTLSGGFSGAQNLTIGGAGATTLSGDLAIGAGTLTKESGGMLTLSAASTRSGDTSFSGATLTVGAQGALGSGTVTGTSNSVLAFNTATDATFSNAMNLSSANDNSIRNNSTTSTVTLNGNLSGSSPGFYTFVGTGAGNAGFVLGGSNTFNSTRVVVKDTSLTIANNGAVNAPGFQRVSLGDSGGAGAAVYLLDGINLNVKVVDSNNNDITGPMAFTVGMKTAGTATFSGTNSGNVAVDLHVRSTGGTSNAWNFEAVTGATANFTGAIVNTGTNAQSPITKTGLGTVVFSGTNSYDGTTTVSAGTLLINGNQSTAIGALTVNANATLGGNGSIGGTVNVSTAGTISPGNSAGNLILNNGLTLAGTYLWELGGLSTANPGSNYDTITITTGAADITGAALGLNLGSFAPSAVPFWQADQTWAGILNNTGAGALTGAFTISTDQTPWASLGTFSTTTTAGSNDVNLVWTAVPEPSGSILVSSLGVLALLRRRRCV